MDRCKYSKMYMNNYDKNNTLCMKNHERFWKKNII